MFNDNNGGNWKQLQRDIKCAREQIRRNDKKTRIKRCSIIEVYEGTKLHHNAKLQQLGLLHHINKHLTRIAHSDLKRLSTTGYVFAARRHLRAAAALRAIAATVAVPARTAAMRRCRSRTERGEVGVAGAAVAAHVVF